MEREVHLAKMVAHNLGADRIVLLYTTSDGKLGYASYGQTKALCESARALADKLYETAYEELK